MPGDINELPKSSPKPLRPPISGNVGLLLGPLPDGIPSEGFVGFGAAMVEADAMAGCREL